MLLCLSLIRFTSKHFEGMCWLLENMRKREGRGKRDCVGSELTKTCLIEINYNFFRRNGEKARN